MNVHDSEKLAGILEHEGYVKASSVSGADVILLNTCSIREKAAEKVFSELGRLRPLKRVHPDLILGVCGCVAQQQGREVFARAPVVDFVIGPRAIGSLGNHRCTYCVVPTTRGREVCRDMDDVLAEVRLLVAQGILEVEFLGQTVNAYRDARGRTLADLLRASAEIEDLRRIRFTTSHPAQMTEALMDAMAAAGSRMCPYLHLPAQSGSNAVLRAMRRGHDRGDYLRKIDGLRRRLPGLALGTDFIVGFPSEAKADFEQTMSLLEEVRFDTVYAFEYSARPGTAALKLGDALAPEEKRARLRRLQIRQREIQEENNRAWIGRDVEVLVAGLDKREESKWTGRTPENRVVHFAGESAPGRIERVRVLAATAYSLQAEPIGTFA